METGQLFENCDNKYNTAIVMPVHKKETYITQITIEVLVY